MQYSDKSTNINIKNIKEENILIISIAVERILFF